MCLMLKESRSAVEYLWDIFTLAKIHPPVAAVSSLRNGSKGLQPGSTCSPGCSCWPARHGGVRPPWGKEALASEKPEVCSADGCKKAHQSQTEQESTPWTLCVGLQWNPCAWSGTDQPQVGKPGGVRPRVRDPSLGKVLGMGQSQSPDHSHLWGQLGTVLLSEWLGASLLWSVGHSRWPQPAGKWALTSGWAEPAQHRWGESSLWPQPPPSDLRRITFFLQEVSQWETRRCF